MSDNVIILGAGSSFDAGVPLLSGFVEKMREYAFKGKSEEGPLSDPDKKIFEKAMKVIKNLYNYHGGANFDDRNIEDILSVLSFNILGRTLTEKDSLNSMIRAIARTIELSCKVKHSGALDIAYHNSETSIYKSLWSKLFKRFNDSPNIPTIVTFNYDLVLERALFQSLIDLGERELSFDGFILRYHYKYLTDLCYKIKKTEYRVHNEDNPFAKTIGTKLERCEDKDLNKPLTIELLKLHGSLNFPR
jgi:hypothetical protein